MDKNKICPYCCKAIYDNYVRCLSCDAIIKWCDNLMKYWKSKDIKQILSLFDSEKGTFYDDPFSKAKPAKELWQEIEEQRIININKSILSIGENQCVVEFTILYENETCKAVNYIKFNEYNQKCIYLKQWYMCN